MSVDTKSHFISFLPISNKLGFDRGAGGPPGIRDTFERDPIYLKHHLFFNDSDRKWGNWSAILAYD